MPIEVRCECGRRLHAPDEAAGLKVRCPACRAAVSVPAAVTAPRKQSRHRRSTDGDQRPVPPPAPLPKRQSARPGKNVFRPRGGGPLPSEIKSRRRKKRRKLSRSEPETSWTASLTFPFRTEALLAICILTFLYTCIMVPIRFAAFTPIMMSPRFVVGLIFIMLLVQGYFWHFLFQIMRTAAYNEPDLPMTADWDPESIIYDLMIAVGCTLVSFVPLIVYAVIQLSPFLLEHPFLSGLIAFLGVLNLPFLMLGAVSSLPTLIPLMLEISPALPWIVSLWVAVAFFYLPMALLACVLHQTVKAALPWYVIPALVRVRWAYLETLVLVIGVAGIGAFFQLLAAFVPIIGAFLTWFIVLAGHAAVMHRLGAMYYDHRHALGWFPDSPRVV